MKRPIQNRLNDLSPRDWIKFQKSWFVHNPSPRRKAVLRHPAKFPESLVEEFITFFTKSGGWVLDPMAGTGSALIGALRQGRPSLGVELNPEYAQIARGVIAEERLALDEGFEEIEALVIDGDAASIGEIAAREGFPPIDYVITSPPYWDMLHARGAGTQTRRRGSAELDVVYSQDSQDLGNISDYDVFLDRLVGVYAGLQPLLREGAYLTIVVKNVKKGGRVYPLAWDLGRRLGEVYALKDERIWCQDNQKLAPYGMGSAWVSNTFHHYCLQFRKE